MQNESLPIDYQGISALGYDYVKEKTYTAHHPDVISWTNFFLERFREKKIFENFVSASPQPSFPKAAVVGVQWHRFSELVPSILCTAASLVSNNRLRHYVIQTAYEELGARSVDEIHHEMFWQTTMDAGVDQFHRNRMSQEEGITEALDFLQSGLALCKTDEEILGLLLGLEICAQENIETVFSSLAHTHEVEKTIGDSKFFKLHRQLELEHIRLDVSTFLRFCKHSNEKMALFVKGFDVGVQFWEKFWSATSSLVTREQQGALSA